MTKRQQWSSRSVGSRLQHHIFYGLIRIGGRNAAYGLLFFVVLWYTIRPDIRARSAPYLSRRFPGTCGWKKVSHCFLLQWELGKSLVDRAVAGIMNRFEMTTSPEDVATIKGLHARGRGIILVSGHVGCWQMATAGLDAMDSRIHILLHREEGDVDRHYHDYQGHTQGVTTIDPHGYLGGALEMTTLLKRGEILCTMGDRFLGTGRNTVEVYFLGDPIRVPISPYRLASATGAPVIVTFSLRTGPGRAKHVITRVIDVPKGLGPTARAYKEYAQAFVHELETICRNHPYQFFNFYDMWNIEST
jgi:predicted LPLAT superfamily acyltransferase